MNITCVYTVSVRFFNAHLITGVFVFLYEFILSQKTLLAQRLCTVEMKSNLMETAVLMLHECLKTSLSASGPSVGVSV